MDDEPLIRHAVARHLRAHIGCDVAPCGDRSEAVAAVDRRSAPPAALVLDWHIGTETGGDVLAAIRVEGIDAPCAFFSSAPANLIARAVEETASCFPKPDLAPLLDWLATVLG